MKQKIRTPIKLLILTALMLGLSVTSAFAAVGDYNGSTVKGTSSCGSGSFENTASGYRIYICNPDGTRASNVIDIRFSDPKNYKQSYYNDCKTNTWFVCESIKQYGLYCKQWNGFNVEKIKTIHVNKITGLKGTMPKPIDVSSTGAGKSLVPKGGELKTFLKKNGQANLTTILDTKENGNFIFNFLDKRDLARTKPTDKYPKGRLSVAETLSRDGGYVCIEPIFWCVPQGIKNGQALSFNCVFYGTTTNYAQFAKAVGLGDGGNGGWLQQIFGKYGLTTLYIGLDDDSLKADKMKVFRVPQKVGGVYCPIKGIIGRKYVLQPGSKGGLPGYAMHYIVIDGENPKDRTHTYDKEIPNKPHPAPEISEKKITEDTKKNGDDPEKRIFQYRIIKVYEEQDKEGTRKHKITTESH